MFDRAQDRLEICRPVEVHEEGGKLLELVESMLNEVGISFGEIFPHILVNHCFDESFIFDLEGPPQSGHTLSQKIDGKLGQEGCFSTS